MVGQRHCKVVDLIARNSHLYDLLCYKPIKLLDLQMGSNNVFTVFYSPKQLVLKDSDSLFCCLDAYIGNLVCNIVGCFTCHIAS